MTDNEIIGFVEYAMHSAKGEDGFKEIYWEHFKDILDLINRQKAEIERLRMQQSELIADYKQIAINAMKKFVERVKDRFAKLEFRDDNPHMKQKGDWILHEVIPIEVDKLLKEMEGK